MPQWLSRQSASLVRTRSRVQISPEAFLLLVRIFVSEMKSFTSMLTCPVCEIAGDRRSGSATSGTAVRARQPADARVAPADPRRPGSRCRRSPWLCAVSGNAYRIAGGTGAAVPRHRGSGTDDSENAHTQNPHLKKSLSSISVTSRPEDPGLTRIVGACGDGPAVGDVRALRGGVAVVRNQPGCTPCPSSSRHRPRRSTTRRHSGRP